MSENREATEETTAPHLLKVAGVGMAALLALSACTSMEISEAPALEDIHEDVFASMQDAENVTMVTEGDALDTDVELIDEDDDLDSDEVTVTVAGAVDGSASHVQVDLQGQEMEFLLNDEGFYYSGETMAFFFEQSAEESGLDIIDMDALAEELEGSWVETPAEDGSEFAFDEGLSSMEEDFLEPDDDSIFPWSEGDLPEGEVEERDGEEVWVYAADEGELVLAADPEAPRILSVEGQDQDGNPLRASFSDWDETTYEESIPENDVLTLEEVDEIMVDLIE